MMSVRLTSNCFVPSEIEKVLSDIELLTGYRTQVKFIMKPSSHFLFTVQNKLE